MKNFREIFSQPKKILSFEFFPPKKEENLTSTTALMKQLSNYDPDFMTVTYGAGGGTRSFTKYLVSFIANELNIPAISHLTCVGHSASELKIISEELYEDGIRHILALRGDPPHGASNFEAHPEGFSCARDLVKFLAENKKFDLAVAGYPETHKEAISEKEELNYLKEKEDAGSSLIITQLFFDSQVYFDFCKKAQSLGITSPILPGIMPISNVQQLEKFTGLCGASVPEWLLTKLKSVESEPEKVLEIGIEHAVKQVKELLAGGAPGIHFYTINKLNQIEVILKNVHQLFN
jgi:methylenetetrahydrofolate reductase (NADPH)